MSNKHYEDDINDLVEQDLNHEETFYKGGPGSGKKGHKTVKPSHRDLHAHHEREYRRLYTLADDFESSSDHELRATGKKFREEGSKHEGLAEHHRKLTKSDLNDLVEDEFEKGRGPDKQPRKQRGSLSHIADQDASDAHRKEAKARVNAIVAARTAKMTDAQRSKMKTATPDQKDAKIRENDKKIANHPVKTSKESPTGG